MKKRPLSADKQTQPFLKVGQITESDFRWAEFAFTMTSGIKCNEYILSPKSQPIPLIITYLLKHKLAVKIHFLRRSTVS